MTEDRLVWLITRQMSGELGPEEVQELEKWANESAINRQFVGQFAGEALLEKEIELWKNIDPTQGFAKWVAYKRAQRKSRILKITGYSAAASLLIAVALGSLIVKMHPAVSPAKTITATGYPVMPGRNTATLTLGNGQKILLDSAGKGELARQGNTRLVKADSGSLAYEGVGSSVGMTYNVLTTPRSGQYHLRLSDGSEVWLNNVSSLRYPASFQGKDRTVELTGEAYFEIAKNAAKPFIVKVRDERVEVMGTSFNVMAYPEEGGTQTTLLTGIVRVKDDIDAVQLKPDEQAQVIPGGGLKVLKDVSGQDIVSWKNGFFYFGRASFAVVMRQLARWYDIEVVYGGKAPEAEFGGKIDRSLPLNELLKYLETNQIHFRLEGRKLIVLPN